MINPTPPRDKAGLDQAALDSLSVAPPDPAKESGPLERADATDPRQQAGQDAAIAQRLKRDPGCIDAKLDRGLDESMDASDPPAATQPGHGNMPASSSGFEEAAERASDH